MWITPSLNQIKETDRRVAGGKAVALATLAGSGMRVPDGACLTVKAYNDFISFNGIRGRILVELGRKDLKDMRWEEMWDTSQRIRNLIIGGSFPEDMRKEIRRFIRDNFKGTALVIRSSSPAEDSSKTSYAGVHESYVDIRGISSIEESILGVWASLWSDASLVYRKELGVDTSSGGMAVVLQRLIRGEFSGVAFSENPMDPSEIVIEAVPGLNKLLVDGEVEPHRWIIDRKKGYQKSYSSPRPKKKTSGVGPRDRFSQKRIDEVVKLARISEDIFKSPQDVEWTFKGDVLYVLQSRPITTVNKKGLSERSVFDLSLKRSFRNLEDLRKKIEGQLIPRINEQTRSMKEKDLTALADNGLVTEISRRVEALEGWNKVYWDDFIPYGHGMRLFGQVYNDILRPEDPHEFIEMLRPETTLSLERDKIFFKMASMVSRKRPPVETVRKGGRTGVGPFDRLYQELLDKYGAISPGLEDPAKLAVMLEKMSLLPRGAKRKKPEKKALMEKRFFDRVPKGQKKKARELLDLARSSYVMRDDDNVYLAGIEKELERAVGEALSRIGRARNRQHREALKRKFSPVLDHPLLGKTHAANIVKSSGKRAAEKALIRPKQLRGQPASKGIARGKARVVLDPSQIKELRPGEILVCDSIGPEMTYAVSLAGGIVERRGGMLIHGAIVAREYGIPCVTGVPDAATLLRTGDEVTIDGYMGLVIVTKDPL